MEAAEATSDEIKALIDEAVRIVGSQKRLGEFCGCSQNKVWLTKEGKIPLTAEFARGVHQATDGRVPGSKLRPDLWAKPEHVPLAPAAVGA